MLYVCTDIKQFQSFFDLFQKRNEGVKCIDLSTVTPESIVAETDSILQHHKECCVFLGYIEPGWMLDPSHQTRIRKLFRKFPVGLVVEHIESLPHSWKNEIDIVYTYKDLKTYGESNSVDDGCAVHHKFEV